MKKFYLFFAFLATVVCLYAFMLTTNKEVPVTVTVSGYITEELSENGINEVTITCRVDDVDRNSSNSRGDGYYSIKVPKGEESELTFTHSAYKDESVKLENPTSEQRVDVEMKLKSAPKSKWW